MAAFLLLVALVCLAGGGAALFTGFDILLGDRGFPIIVAGSVLLAAGLVLIGLVIVARAVRRLERAILDAWGRQAESAHLDPATTGEARSLPPVPALGTPERGVPAPPIVLSKEENAAIAGEGAIDDMPELPLPQPAAPELLPHGPAREEPKTAAGADPATEPASPATVVGRYSSAGNNYVMFSDGTIEAETPTGQHRFNSLDELRAFVAAGGEGAAA